VSEAPEWPAPRAASALARPLARMFDALRARASIPFRVVLPDGEVIAGGGGPPAFSVRVHHRRTLLAIAQQGHVALLEAYFDGDIDVEGDMALAFRAALAARADYDLTPWVALRNRWHERRFGNGSLAQAKANASFHYDLGRDFYRLWLDRVGMLYTCGYWPEGTATLEDAQRLKMEHVCRKVQLARGETFVDIGCGFGGLLRYAWETRGALGTGINTAPRQVEELRSELARDGLADRLPIIECDFREVPGQYDKLFSIGTLEHAGRDQLPTVVRAHAAALKPGGLGVIHFIGHVGSFDTEFYIRKYVFPGGWIPSLAQALAEMERSGLEILDVENLRRHYALTLDEWARRFDAGWEQIHLLDPVRFDERFRRIWRTYLWSCAEMFRSNNSRTHLFQVTVSKGNVDERYPMSRAFLHRP
jgi:cyclopropane-fatty-acyl-phospholipid synthase